MSAVLPDGVLLDTCALIWLINKSRLTVDAQEAIFHAGRAEGVYVSPISAWEIGMISRPNRASDLKFLPDPKTWFATAMTAPTVRSAPLTPEIAIDASYLPEPLHGDPADRLLIATARHLRIPIVTRDAKIIAYADHGHVQTIEC